MISPVRILVADDHAIVRQGFINIIESDPNFRVVAQSGDGAEVMDLLREVQPEIAVVDISMPHKSGLEILRVARQENLLVKFIILTMYNDEAYFEEAFSLGINGYLLKDNTATELISCIHAVHQNRYYFSADISDYLVEQTRRAKSFYDDRPEVNEFTPSEKRILKLIAESKSNREIAEALNLSIRTVQNHRYNICQKLSLSGHNKLLQFAIEHKASL
jgi:DNA-binding NarL/FixJ family response regulator